MPGFPIFLESPALFVTGLALSLFICAIAFVHRVRLPGITLTLFVIGLILLSLVAGGAALNTSTPPRIAVMIDVSASTRTAGYHDTAVLINRVKQLVGDRPYSTYCFSDQLQRVDIAQAQIESLAGQTLFTPPSADAIVLFSDGQFDLPRSAPPTFVMVDPALDHVNDAAVVCVEARGDQLTTTVRNTFASPQQVNFTNATPATQLAPVGETELKGKVLPDARDLLVAVAAHDAWPENNALFISAPPLPILERWWIANGRNPAPAGWRTMTPAELDNLNGQYFRAGVIALANVSRDELPSHAIERLWQYVRDAGGGMMILGGNRAFASGGYAGSTLERLSPLASNPPTPATRWIMLIDSSGSMSQALGDTSRWNFAVSAALHLIPTLPPHDPLSIGNFARDVRWWTTDTSIERIDLGHLVPRDLSPSGPTNLQPVLEQIARSNGDATPTQLIVITDAEASIDNPQALASELSQKQVHVNLLTNATLSATSPLKQIVAKTGGRDLIQSNPRRWFDSLRQLLIGAAPPWLERSPFRVHFADLAEKIPDQSATPWNRTWLKPNATQLAGGSNNAQSVPAVAAWKIGAGAVLSAAYMPAPAVVDSLAEIVATPPRDPRFAITWETGPHLRVRLDAMDNGRFLNDLHPHLSMLADQSTFNDAHEIPQTAPGHYELSIPAPRQRALARLFVDDHLLDRVVVAGRYAPEFDAIGNNRAAMRALADLSGGEVIEPSRVTPIRFPPGVKRKIPVATPLAIAAFCCIAGAIVRWKLASR